MFLGFSIFKVEGNSMSPTIPDQSYVMARKAKSRIAKESLLIIDHKNYGKILKKLVKVDDNKNLWFEGENLSSVSKEMIGPIKFEEVIGKVVFVVKNRDFI